MIQQFKSLFFNLSPESRFIIIGIFFILILNILPFVKILDLLVFFVIYACYEHIKSKPKLNKDRLLMSLSIMIILFLEILNLYNYIISKSIIQLLISFFLFISYLQTNPTKTPETFKAFLINFFQLFAVLICYFFVIESIVVAHLFEPIVILTVINMLILASCNILTKKNSLVLEIICFAYLFFVFMMNFPLVFIDNIELQLELLSQLSFKNNIAIFIIFINIIGLSIIFLKNKNYPEKAKIFLIILLTISLFIPNYCIFYFNY